MHCRYTWRQIMQCQQVCSALNSLAHRRSWLTSWCPLSRQTSKGIVLFCHKVLHRSSGLNVGCRVCRNVTSTRILVLRDTQVIHERSFSCYEHLSPCCTLVMSRSIDAV